MANLIDDIQSVHNILCGHFMNAELRLPKYLINGNRAVIAVAPTINSEPVEIDVFVDDGGWRVAQSEFGPELSVENVLAELFIELGGQCESD